MKSLKSISKPADISSLSVIRLHKSSFETESLKIWEQIELGGRYTLATNGVATYSHHHRPSIYRRANENATLAPAWIAE